jgi:hypothetical protein
MHIMTIYTRELFELIDATESLDDCIINLCHADTKWKLSMHKSELITSMGLIS